MALFKISRGTAKNLPAVLTEGYCWYTYDNSKFYIDFKDENGVLTRKALNAHEAEKLIGYDIVTILNSSDVEIPTSKAVLTALSGKANATHDHNDKYYTESEIDTKLASKSDTDHTHDGRYYTETEIDTKLASKANTADIPDALADLSSDSTHRTVTDTEKATWNAKSNFSGNYNDLTNKPTIPSISGLATQEYVDDIASTKVDKVTGKGLSANDLTDTLKSNYDAAYIHSQSTHARTDATKVTDSTTNGNILINGTETNVYTHPNSGVSAGTYKSVTVNAQGHVTAGSNPTTLSGYGITDAETKTDAATKLDEAKTYADNAVAKVKNDLLNGAGTAYDTLKELGDLIDVNVDAIEALEQVAAGKANASDLTTHINNKSNPHGVALSTFGVTATASELNILDGVTATAAEINRLDGITATTVELNYVDGVTSNIQTQLNAKQATITGAATTITGSDLTTGRALISDANGKVAVSAVTSTELGYLDGVTSAIQAQIDGKAASSHGTHVTYSTTAPAMDGTAAVGTATTVARSDHKHPTDTSRAAQADLTSHTGNTTAHITATERTNWGTAYTHSQTAHAPSNAEKNQNAFSNIAVSGQTTVAADAATDTVTFAGSNVTITTDATNDKVTFAVADGTTSAKGIVQLTNSTSSTSTTTAATPNSVKVAYDLATTANTAASTVQTNLNTEIARAKAAEAQILIDGKSDWSISDANSPAYIANKPVHSSDINITWNGSTSGKTYVSTASGETYCKMSDTVFATYDFVNGNASVTLYDTYFNTSSSFVVAARDITENNGALVISDYYVISVPRNNTSLTIGSESVTFQSAGTYFRYLPEMFYVSSLKMSNMSQRITANNLPLGIASKVDLEQYKADGAWDKIYDSTTSSNVNAIFGINISGYTKLKLAIKCVNVTSSAGTTAGAVTFTGENGVNYSFSSLFGNLVTNTAGTTAAMAEFTIVDGFIICENALRSTSAANMLSRTDGQGAWGLTSVGGGIITCGSPTKLLRISTTNNSTTHYYGTGSRVIVWGCKA